MKILFSLTESPFPPDFQALYRALGIEAHHFDSARKLHRALQQMRPDAFVGEFVYGWGNNYAGANVSNLDVTLRTLQCSAPQARTIVLLQPGEAAHVDKLQALFPVHAMRVLPVSEAQMWRALCEAGVVDATQAAGYVPSDALPAAPPRRPPPADYTGSGPAAWPLSTASALAPALRWPPLRRRPPR